MKVKEVLKIEEWMQKNKLIASIINKGKVLRVLLHRSQADLPVLEKSAHNFTIKQLQDADDKIDCALRIAKDKIEEKN